MTKEKTLAGPIHATISIVIGCISMAFEIDLRFRSYEMTDPLYHKAGLMTGLSNIALTLVGLFEAGLSVHYYRSVRAYSGKAIVAVTVASVLNFGWILLYVLLRPK